MDNNTYTQAPKQPSNLNILELIAVICSGVGTLLSILGTILTCSCSANKTFDVTRVAMSSSKYVMSAVFILTIFGVIIAIAGVVLAIITLKQKKASKLSYIAIAVGIFGVLYGLIPTFTICGYNCSLDNAYEDMMAERATVNLQNLIK